MAVVVCKLPKAGLGNQLFPLMHAHVFAALNQLPVIVIGYHTFKIGPYLRGERSKRKYTGYFRFQKSLFGEWVDRIRVWQLKKKGAVVYEPALQLLPSTETGDIVYWFEKMPTYHDYFRHLRDHRKLTVELFFNLLSHQLRAYAEKITAPEIGVHIRMGDFRKLKPGEVFKGGHVRTPESYFTSIIQGLRTLGGKLYSATVFTDGHRHEFEELFNLPEMNMSVEQPDILDMISLSKSKIIVISTGSTFSYWATFLSDAPAVMHPDHIHARIRPEDATGLPFEGGFDTNHYLLKQLIHE